DDLDRGDRGRRPRRSQPREPVAIPRQGFRAAACGDGQPRRQPLQRRAADRRRPARRSTRRDRRQGMKQVFTDVLILGAGGAGLFAALHAKRADPTLDVTIAVKGLLGKCGCTRMVQGGYNVALAPGDSIERHFMDTIEGGSWLNHQELAWALVSTAP